MKRDEYTRHAAPRYRSHQLWCLQSLHRARATGLSETLIAARLHGQRPLIWQNETEEVVQTRLLERVDASCNLCGTIRQFVMLNDLATALERAV